MQFDFDSFIYPPRSYQPTEEQLGLIKYVEYQDQQDETQYCTLCRKQPHPSAVPLLYCPKKNKPLLLYLHANGQNMFNARPFIQCIAQYLDFGYAIQQYPGYSLYQKNNSGRKCDRIKKDCLTIFDYLAPQKVIVFGRSIGTGPALWLCSRRNPLCLILLSAFTGIKALATERYGFVGGIVAEHFQNLQYAESVSCPTLLIHGKEDSVIPASHSVLLSERLPLRSLILVEEMGHSKFDLQHLLDIIESFAKRYISL